MIVCDASVVADALMDPSARGVKARAILKEESLVAPALIDAEVASSVRARLRAGAITEELGSFAVQRLRRLELRRVVFGELVPRMWELRHNLTPYDAAYVAVAEVLDLKLWTADRRLSKAPGIRCTVGLLE